MKMNQLSVFLENRPGRLSHPCKALADAGINMMTLCLADSERFGILRLVVKEWERAKVVLEQAGCVVRVDEVLAIEIPDRPGGMQSVLAALEPKAINIEYMYAFTLKRGGNAVMIVRFGDVDRAVGVLQGSGIRVLDPVLFLSGGSGFGVRGAGDGTKR
jgi:hypothetical protein